MNNKLHPAAIVAIIVAVIAVAVFFFAKGAAPSADGASKPVNMSNFIKGTGKESK